VDSEIIGRVHGDPDPAKPPLAVTFGRTDDGNYVATICLGGIAPVMATTLLMQAAATLAGEAGANKTASFITLAAEMILHLGDAP
jgi:hypothetical protein